MSAAVPKDSPRPGTATHSHLSQQKTQLNAHQHAQSLKRQTWQRLWKMWKACLCLFYELTAREESEMMVASNRIKCCALVRTERDQRAGTTQGEDHSLSLHCCRAQRKVTSCTSALHTDHV